MYPKWDWQSTEINNRLRPPAPPVSVGGAAGDTAVGLYPGVGHPDAGRPTVPKQVGWSQETGDTGGSDWIGEHDIVIFILYLMLWL